MTAVLFSMVFFERCSLKLEVWRPGNVQPFFCTKKPNLQKNESNSNLERYERSNLSFL